MKKAAPFFIILLLFLVPALVHASPSQNPIFATIEQVRQMINDAVSHSTSKALRVYDANNQELGIFVQDYGLDPLFFIPTLSMVSRASFLIEDQDNLYFESNNCTGTPLTTEDPNSVAVDIIKLSGDFYTFVKPSVVVTTTPESRFEGSTATCISIEPGFITGDSRAISQVNLPYHLPIVLPIHVSYQ